MQNDFLPAGEAFDIEFNKNPEKKPRLRLRLQHILYIILGIIAVITLLFFFIGSIEHNLSELEPQEICIVLDAGHGGKDVGCVSGEIYEKDINLAITLQLGEKLQAMGYNVHFTRDDDTFVELYARAEAANAMNAHLFISVHCNAVENPSANGTEVYYNTNGSAFKLADSVFEELIAAIETKPRDTRIGRYVVLTKTEMPGILIETAFLSNEKDRAKLCDAEYQAKTVQAIASGIESYIYGDADK